MSVEPVARAVVGFRSWVLTGSGELLSTGEAFNGGSAGEPPPAARRAWTSPAGVAHAHCARHEVGGMCREAAWCVCGLHAFTEPRHWERSGLVHGAIVAWGRIVVHDRGFRAEHARPIAFLDQPCAWFDRLLARTPLPALPAEELRAYAAWHGDLLFAA